MKVSNGSYLLVAVLASSLGLVGAVFEGPVVGEHSLGDWCLTLAAACGSILVVRAASWVLVDVALARRTGMETSSLVRMLTHWVLYATCLMLIVKFGLGWDITALLTGSAVLGAVGGFALQATLDNLFSGVALQLEHPFQIGDVVRIGDTEGRVEAMTWRAVHLRTEGLSRVVIPNSTLGGESVEVLQSGGSTEQTVEVEADPTAPPGHVCQLLGELLVGLDNVARKPAPEVYPVGLREWLGSRIFEVQYFPEDYLAYESTDALIRRRAWYRLERWGYGVAGRSGQLGAADFSERVRLAPDDVVGVLGRVPVLAALGEEGVRRLAERSEVVLYTEGDEVSDLPDRSPALFVVQRGRLVAQARGLRPEELRRHTTPPDFEMEAWTPLELQAEVDRLTEFVGPVAELLVHRAARQTVDPGRLCHLLAQEIADPELRARYACGQGADATHELVPGDVLGVTTLVGSGPVDLDHVHAASEVTMVRVPASAVRDVLRDDPARLPALVEAVQAWREAHPAGAVLAVPGQEALATWVG